MRWHFKSSVSKSLFMARKSSYTIFTQVLKFALENSCKAFPTSTKCSSCLHKSAFQICLLYIHSYIFMCYEEVKHLCALLLTPSTKILGPDVSLSKVTLRSPISRLPTLLPQETFCVTGWLKNGYVLRK